MKWTSSVWLLALIGCSSAPPEPLSVSRGAEANANWRQGRLAAAQEGYLRALAEDRFRVDLPAAIKHLNNLGVLASFDERPQAAREHFAAALELCSVQPDPDLRARLRLQIASCCLQAEDLDAAAAELAALAPWAEQAAVEDRVQYRLLHTALLLRRGDPIAARAAALAAAAVAETAEDRAAALLLAGKAAVATPALARASFQQALDAARTAGHLPLVIECLLGIAQTLAAEDRAAALRYARIALEAARARGSAALQQRVEQELGQIAR